MVGPYCANLVSQMHITMIGGIINKVSLAFIAGGIASEPFGNSENLVHVSYGCTAQYSCTLAKAVALKVLVELLGSFLLIEVLCIFP